MVKPDIQITDNGLTTQTAIKEAAGLDPSDLKALTARVVQFISENEEATSKTPRAWKKPEWKELAETFMDDEDNGRTYFHHSRGNSNDEDYFFWPEDRDMIIYLGFSLIKLEATKYHSKKRKAEGGDKATPTPKKAKTAKVAAQDSEDQAEDGDDDGLNGAGDNKNDKITVKSAKPVKKTAPAKSDSTAKGKKAASTFKSPFTPAASKTAATKQTNKKAETPKTGDTSDESDNDGVETGSVKRKAPAPSANRFASSASGSGLALAGNSPGTYNDAQILEPEDDENFAEDRQLGNQSIFNNPSFRAEVDNATSPAVAGADDEEIDAQPVLTSVETDEIAMSKYINLPDENSANGRKTTTEHGKDPLIEAAAAMLLKNGAEHEKYPGNANLELTRDESHPAGVDKGTRSDTPHNYRSPGPGPPSESLLQQHVRLQSPTRTPSVAAHLHLPTTISLSLTLLSASDDATSHLMVVPTSATFAEILGRYIVQLPQGDVGHQTLADASNCIIKGFDGKVQKFGFREAGVERLWRAAIGKSVKALKTSVMGGEEDVVEVELR